MEPQWWAICIGQGDQLQQWEGPITIYGDGSGAESSNDPRLRRCGWSWVVNWSNSYYVRALAAYYGEQ
eukprot:9460849-Karenia_brevis.AAC.1